MNGLLERRLHEEWRLLLELASLNPHRFSDLRADDTTFHGVLCGVAAAPVVPIRGSDLNRAAESVRHHAFRVHYPVHFPAVPMELYLHQPVQHPNIHPETGFVCLWDRHRASNTVEMAMHRLAAMLGGQLFNAAAPHVMQPEALAAMGGPAQPEALLRGVRHSAADALRAPAGGRRRLS